MQRAITILKNTFGYDSFRHHQADVINDLLQGKDAFVLMPTGGGKSLCYQIPALVLDGTAIVISPLIALMQDQVDALTQLGIKAAFLNSSLDNSVQQQVENQLLNGDLDLLYVAPERLITSRMLNLLSQTRISLFAIDEAHCVSQWGHDFRKDYQQLSILQQHFPNVPRLALTATADDRTRKDIIQQLGLQNAQVFINSFDRPNIRYTISEGQNNKERLWQFISQHHPQDAGVIYCLSRKNVESVAQWISDKGRIALPYHAGLPAETRQRHQQRFLREENIIIVATIAFGMGIDKPDVRFVGHLNLPKSIEAYYQETGRAGRDGQPANAWMAYGLQDVITLRQMSQDSDASEEHKRVLHNQLETMLGLCEMHSCRRQAILAYFGEQQTKPCGNCDNCLHPPETWDATEVARKALSCVYRTEQKFGVNYIIDVLTGKDDERIKRNRHDQISTFGIGKELSGTEWRSVFRQLIAKGLLFTNVEKHGALFLTENARPALRGEVQLLLRKIVKPVKEKSAAKKSIGIRSVDEPLFNALRAKRLALAQELGVPPYVIFHDNTLLEMTKARPLNDEQFRYISGVGESKLKRFGETFMEIIREFPLPDLLQNTLSDTINNTLSLFADGNDIEMIAKERELSASTIYSHLAEAISAGLLDAEKVLPISKEAFKEIVYALEMSENPGQLKPVFDELDGVYDYGIIKCVQASIQA